MHKTTQQGNVGPSSTDRPNHQAQSLLWQAREQHQGLATETAGANLRTRGRANQGHGEFWVFFNEYPGMLRYMTAAESATETTTKASTDTVTGTTTETKVAAEAGD